VFEARPKRNKTKTTKPRARPQFARLHDHERVTAVLSVCSDSNTKHLARKGNRSPNFKVSSTRNWQPIHT